MAFDPKGGNTSSQSDEVLKSEKERQSLRPKAQFVHDVMEKAVYPFYRKVSFSDGSSLIDKLALITKNTAAGKPSDKALIMETKMIISQLSLQSKANIVTNFSKWFPKKYQTNPQEAEAQKQKALTIVNNMAQACKNNCNEALKVQEASTQGTTTQQ